MATRTLVDLCRKHQGKVSDKWELYLNAYERLLAEYRGKPIGVLEIGVGDGGSLEILSEFFPEAKKLVGCDINPDCAKLEFDDPRIEVVIGDVNSPNTQAQIIARQPTFDVIVDDGSHTSSDIIKSFVSYLPHLNDGGIYIVEDLHCSYWAEYEGGLFEPFSSIAFLKRLVDVINYEHWGLDTGRSAIFKEFERRFGVAVDGSLLAHILSIEFLNSMCVIRKSVPAQNVLGQRVVFGRDKSITEGISPLAGCSSDAPDQTSYNAHKDPIALEREVELAHRRLDQATAEAVRLERQLTEWEARWQDIQQGVAWGVLVRLRRALHILAPPGSARYRWILAAGARMLVGRSGENSTSREPEMGSPAPRANATISQLEARLHKAVQFWRMHGLLRLIGRVREEISTGMRGRGPISAARKMAASSGGLDDLLQERFRSLQPLPGFRVPYASQRLNLVTDSIGARSLFGGVGTSLILSALMAEQWGCELRVITRTERAIKENFRHVLALNRIPWNRNVEFLFSRVGDPRAEVPVGNDEFFLTTSWWTTWSVREAFGEERIIYLLQEDERTFYPLGDDYIRCSEILKSSRIHFLVNSELLYDHLLSEGFENLRVNGLWFEPSFPEDVFFREDRQPGKKIFFFYARPNNLRNLFYLGLEVIDAAVSRGILDPNEWHFYFVGKDIPDIRIAGELRPSVFENVSWADYAALVRTVDLGLCLMLSPHPSYPPLDLAASGAVVVTNRFRNKHNLTRYSPNILCRDLDIESLVQGIAEAVELVADSEERDTNFRVNRILRDWRTSFEHILSRVKIGGGHVSY
ncbi:MAG: class I SAM-dependent methyltransferase [Anaerolineales bacterium]